MNFSLLIYLASVCEAFKITTIVISATFLIFWGIALFIFFIEDDVDYVIEMLPKLRKWVVWAVILLNIGLLTPSEDTLYMMAGADIITDLSKDDKVQKVSSKTLDLLDTWIDNKKKDLEKNADSGE